MGIKAKDIVKEFGNPPQRILHGLNFEILDGKFVSITGRSGSGKSTLLYLISTLDMPTQGQILIDEIDIAQMGVKEIHQFRNKNIGFIFQFHYLLPELSALENILLPPRNLNLHNKYKNKAMELMEEFDIAPLAHKLPGQLSGGEQQRVAISRALIMSPRYLFADEPTGNLDLENGQKVMESLKRVNKELKTTVVLVTHEPDFAAMAEEEIYLVDGRISSKEEISSHGP